MGERVRRSPRQGTSPSLRLLVADCLPAVATQETMDELRGNEGERKILTGMRSAYFCRIRSASALRFSKGCSSLNLLRIVAVGGVITDRSEGKIRDARTREREFVDVALGMFWEKWFAEMEMEMEDEKRIRLRSVCVRSRRTAGTVRRWHPTAQMSGRRARHLPTSGGQWAEAAEAEGAGGTVSSRQTRQ